MAQPTKDPFSKPTKDPFPSELIALVITNLDVNADRNTIVALLRVSQPVWHLAAKALYTNLDISGDTVCALLLGGADTTPSTKTNEFFNIIHSTDGEQLIERERSRSTKKRHERGVRAYGRAHRFLHIPFPSWFTLPTLQYPMDGRRSRVEPAPTPTKPDVMIPLGHCLSTRTRLALSFVQRLNLRDLTDDAVNVMRHSALRREPLFPGVSRIHVYSTSNPYSSDWQVPAVKKVFHSRDIVLFNTVDICAWQIESAAIAEYLSPKRIRSLSIHNDLIQPMATTFSFDRAARPSPWTSESVVHWFIQATLEFDRFDVLGRPVDLRMPFARCWVGEQIDSDDVPLPLGGPVGGGWFVGPGANLNNAMGFMANTVGVQPPAGPLAQPTLPPPPVAPAVAPGPVFGPAVPPAAAPSTTTGAVPHPVQVATIPANVTAPMAGMGVPAPIALAPGAPFPPGANLVLAFGGVGGGGFGAMNPGMHHGPEVIRTGDWDKHSDGHQFRMDSKKFKHAACCVCGAKGCFEERDFGVVFTKRW
ncbi:hypothetical protein Q8F55_000574 [Vanrija albida]|uniref:F-box domain-containing protein n=1 Tax=Vanrija albida TaxID=181172 RepID=A0ABR3QDN5_9TREE